MLVRHRFNHRLGLDRATRMVDAAVEHYKGNYGQYPMVIEWLGERRLEVLLELKGKRLKGEVSLGERAIDITLDVPLVFSIFKKRRSPRSTGNCGLGWIRPKPACSIRPFCSNLTR